MKGGERIMSRISVYTKQGWVLLGTVEDSIADYCAMEYALLLNEPVACQQM